MRRVACGVQVKTRVAPVSRSHRCCCCGRLCDTKSARGVRLRLRAARVETPAGGGSWVHAYAKTPCADWSHDFSESRTCRCVHGPGMAVAALLQACLVKVYIISLLPCSHDVPCDTPTAVTANVTDSTAAERRRTFWLALSLARSSTVPLVLHEAAPPLRTTSSAPPLPERRSC